MSIPNTKLNIPSRISAAMPTATPPRHKGQCPMLPLPLRTMLSTMPFRCRSMSLPYLPFFRLLLVSFGLGGSGRVLFLFASPYVRSFLVPSSTASVVFVSGASQRSGSRISKFFFSKYYPWKGVEIFRQKICVPNPVFTFAPATKMTRWYRPEGGMETEAYMERRKGKGSGCNGATRHGKRQRAAQQ